MTTQKQHPYHSYLLRLWGEHKGNLPQWRASLESAQTGDKYHFASLEALFAFLRRQAIATNNQVKEQRSAGFEDE